MKTYDRAMKTFDRAALVSFVIWSLLGLYFLGIGLSTYVGLITELREVREARLTCLLGQMFLGYPSAMAISGWISDWAGSFLHISVFGVNEDAMQFTLEWFLLYGLGLMQWLALLMIVRPVWNFLLWLFPERSSPLMLNGIVLMETIEKLKIQ